MEKTITKSKDGITAIVKITKTVKNDIAYLDGANINLGKKTQKNIHITLQKGNAKITTSDTSFFYILSDQRTIDRMPQAYARLGDNYISEVAYNLIKAAIAEAEVSLEVEQEYKKVEESENNKKIQAGKNRKEIAEMEAKRTANGYCHKCGSYCHGDCESN